MRSINSISLRVLPTIAIGIAFLIYYHMQKKTTDAKVEKIEQIIQLKPSIEKDSLLRVLEMKDIKEEIYINHLGFMSDWIILFVTAVFGIVLLVQFVTFENRVQSVENKYELYKTERDKHVLEVEKRFNKSEADTLRIFVRSIIFQSNYCAEKGSYKGALKINTDIINVMLKIKELDEDINEFNSAMINDLNRCYSNIFNMYSRIDAHQLDFTFFFTSSEATSYKSYFNELYGKVNEVSREKIKEILSKLDEGISMAEQIKHDKTTVKKSNNEPKQDAEPDSPIIDVKD